MVLVTCLFIVSFWWLLTIIPDYQDNYKDVRNDDFEIGGRSLIHSIFTMPLMLIGLMFLFKKFFGMGAVVFFFNFHLLVLVILGTYTLFWWIRYRFALNTKQKNH